MLLPRHSARPTVAVIDDDPDVRESIEGLLRSAGLRAEVFASIQEFLGGARLDQLGCLVLDVWLQGRSGLDFHADLVKANWSVPVIFISGHADIPMSVRAIKAGAVEFLTKPFRRQELLDAVEQALGPDPSARAPLHGAGRPPEPTRQFDRVVDLVSMVRPHVVARR